MTSINQDKRPFKLSALLKGHSQDVKSVKFISQTSIYSCSRDSTTRVWNKKSDSNNGWSEKSLYQNSNPGFLNAVERIVIDGEEFLITAGQDTLIQLWPISPNPNESYEPRFVLAGHSSNVCCLNVHHQTSTIYSGSWDCTSIVWRNNRILYNLTGHSAAVWAVIGLDDRRTLTGAADNLIFLWDKSAQASVFKGHTQAVRALARLSDQVFASAGNDATIRLWNLENNQALKVLDGHDSFIYSLDILPTGELVSCGEDRSVRVWDPQTGSINQTITVPAISVWTVSVCQENGDLSCGSSDNMIRIFSRSDQRWAPADELKAFEESVKASSVPSATVGDVKKSDLPTTQALLARTGKKEGEVAMARNETNGAVEAYQWDSIKRDWTMVGTVVDGIGSSRKQLYEGREYDYVFDVDIQDGVPPLKLPYNVSENPYTVAQKWLAKNELPDSYLDQVVQFIDKNTSGVSIGGGGGGADPFTGSNSYRPSAGNLNNQNQGLSSVGGGSDPFTGTGSYKTNQTNSSSFSPSSNTLKLIPHKTFLTFESPKNFNYSTILEKLKKFNSELSGTGLELTLNDLSSIQNFIDLMFQKKDPITRYDEVKGFEGIYSSAMKVIQKIVGTWPDDKKFPGIDLIRIISINRFPKELISNLFDLIDSSLKTLSSSPPNSSPIELNLTLILRSFSNALASVSDPKLKKIEDKDLGLKMIEFICGINENEGGKGRLRIDKSKLRLKNCKVALVTLILNFSVMSVNGVLDDESDKKFINGLFDCNFQLIEEGYENEEEEEVVYRSLISIGNLVWKNNKILMSNSSSIDQKKETIKKIDLFFSDNKSDRVKQILGELKNLLNS